MQKMDGWEPILPHFGVQILVGEIDQKNKS